MQIFEFINVIIETAIMLFYCNNIFNRKQSLNKGIRALLISVVIIITTLTSINRLGTCFNLTVSFCICFTISYFIYEGTRKIKLFISAIYVVIFIFADILATIVIMCFGIEYSMSGGDDVTYIVGAMLSDFIRLWLLAYVGKILRGRIYDLPVSYWIFMFVCPILSVMCLIIFDIYLMQAETVNQLLVFIPSFCILYINFMLFSFFKTFSEKIKLKVVEELAQREEENYRILQNNESELREMRHNMRNNIMMLNEYLKNGDAETALKHLGDIQNTLEQIPAAVCTSNPAIDAAINIGGRKAQLEDIDYKVQIIGNRKVFVEAGDICNFLSNAIDNAIEGCMNCKEQYIYIELNISQSNLKIHIENSTLRQDKPHMFEFMTTKPDKKNHGYGMKSMKAVVKKYNGIMNTVIDDGIFYLDTILYNVVCEV